MQLMSSIIVKEAILTEKETNVITQLLDCNWNNYSISEVNFGIIKVEGSIISLIAKIHLLHSTENS